MKTQAHCIIALMAAIVFSINEGVAQDTLITDTIPLSALGIEDTYVVNRNYKDDNYNSTSKLKVMNFREGVTQPVYTSRTYIKFNTDYLKEYLGEDSIDVYEVTLNLGVRSSTKNTNAFETYLSLVGEDWDSDSITFMNQPDIFDKKKVVISHSDSVGTYHSYDVTEHIKASLDHPNLAYGWQIRLKNEVPLSEKGVIYFPIEDSRRLESYIIIRYRKPVKVHAEVHQCKSGNDGEIKLNELSPLANFYQYDWYDQDGNLFSHNRNVSNLSAGWYYVTVSNPIYSQPSVTKFFIITCPCEIYNFSIPLREVYTSDAMTKYSSGTPGFYQLFQNYGNSPAFESVDATFYTYTPVNGFGLESYTSNSYMKFDNFWGIDPNDIYRANLTLKNNGSNLFYNALIRFENISQFWAENTINLINSPSLISGDYLNFSYDSNYASVNITQDFIDMLAGNLNKFGYRFEVLFGGIYVPMVNSYYVNKADYFSSNNADNAVPVLDLTIGESCVCAEPKYDVDGNYFVNNNGQMCVFYENEYNEDDVAVRIYDVTYETLVATDVNFPNLFDNFHFGENNLVFDFSDENCLCDGKYIMEIENGKGEIKYLKFINTYKICCELIGDPGDPAE